jgi:hypothetical protein
VEKAANGRLSWATALLLLAPAAGAQDPAEGDAAGDVWELSGSLLYSDPPGSEDRLTPILYGDRGPLHLELRYNYEDLETAALFAGWTFDVQGEIEGGVTPMLGGVAGDTDGIAPGLEFDLGWRRLAWYTEAEYLFDFEDRDDDFFYAWSTLTYGITDWLSAGLVTERSKLVDTDYSVQRGLALEFTAERLDFSLYAFNLGSDDSYAVVGLGFGP